MQLPQWLKLVLVGIGTAVCVSAGVFAYRYFTHPVTLTVAAGTVDGTAGALVAKHVNLEFVSANPTGPIHIGGARWAAVGDALGRILSTQGATVVREYYFNDAGAQIDRFARSRRPAMNRPPRAGTAATTSVRSPLGSPPITRTRPACRTSGRPRPTGTRASN